MFYKRITPEQPCQLTQAKLPLEHALILICEKCGKKKEANSQASETESTRLQKSLKASFSTKLGKGQIKPVLAGCMSLCPENEITIGIVPLQTEKTQPIFFTLKNGSTLEQTEKVMNEALKFVAISEHHPQAD